MCRCINQHLKMHAMVLDMMVLILNHVITRVHLAAFISTIHHQVKSYRLVWRNKVAHRFAELVRNIIKPTTLMNHAG
jgi:hypothetical protein